MSLDFQVLKISKLRFQTGNHRCITKNFSFGPSYNLKTLWLPAGSTSFGRMSRGCIAICITLKEYLLEWVRKYSYSKYRFFDPVIHWSIIKSRIWYAMIICISKISEITPLKVVSSEPDRPVDVYLSIYGARLCIVRRLLSTVVQIKKGLCLSLGEIIMWPTTGFKLANFNEPVCSRL